MKVCEGVRACGCECTCMCVCMCVCVCVCVCVVLAGTQSYDPLIPQQHVLAWGTVDWKVDGARCLKRTGRERERKTKRGKGRRKGQCRRCVGGGTMVDGVDFNPGT